MKTFISISALLLLLTMTGCVTNDVHTARSGVPINTPAALLAPKNYLETMPYDGQLHAAMLAPTGSMRPTLQDHDLILYTKKSSFHDISVGDIILFKGQKMKNGNHELVCHRVIYRTDSFLSTKGDNNSIADPYRIKEEDYYGKLVAIVRGANRNQTLATVASL